MNKLQKWASKLLGISEAIITGDGYDNEGWRNISQRSNKGLDMFTRDNQLRKVFVLFLKNPLAKAMLDTINDFVFGDGFAFDIVDKSGKLAEYKVDNIKKIIQKFWDNNLSEDRLEKKGIDLSLNGMLCLPTFVNEQNGEVNLGFIDPMNIQKVIANPLNVEDIQLIRMKRLDALGNGQKELKTVKSQTNVENLNSKTYGMLSGDCFFFTINNVSNQPEGVSDLLNSADMISDFETLTKSILQHAELSHLCFQKVTITGAGPKEVEAWKAANPIPEAGSRIVTNDSVKYELMMPDIKGIQISELVRIFKNLILMSKRLPEHWFSDGSNSNKATSVEMGTAIYTLIKKRQKLWIGILKKIFTYVCHQAIIAKMIDKTDFEKVEIKIIVPEFVTKDMKLASEALDKVSDFLNKGAAAGYITNETAGKVYRSLCVSIGYQIDEISEESRLTQIADEKAKKPKTPEPIDTPVAA